MPFTNLNPNHLSPEKLVEVKNALSVLENAFDEVKMTLTPDERKRYGRVNEQNKLFVNKVFDYHKNQPQLSVPDIDWAEFEKDYESRKDYENILTRLDEISLIVRNTKILHDFDNYQAALRDYNYTLYHARNGAPGYETKMREMKVFFPRTKRNKPNPESPTEEEV